MTKSDSTTSNQAWSVPGRRLLSLRRYNSFIYLRLKRKVGLDYSFQPPSRSDVPIDLFIPAIEKDAVMLDLALDYAKTNILHPIKHIYIIGPAKSKHLRQIAERHKAQFVEEETVLGFPKEDVDYIVGNLNRNGWIYKMLINFAADTISQSRYILIHDADTCFIAPQVFLHRNRPLFNLSNEYNQEYFDATERLLGIKHHTSRSFTTHYMLFDAEVLKSMRAAIETRWHRPWYRAIIDNIDKTKESGFSDYETYGDYYLTCDQPKPIFNYWSNESLTIDSLRDIKQIITDAAPYFRSVSFHNYQPSYMSHAKGKSKAL